MIKVNSEIINVGKFPDGTLAFDKENMSSIWLASVSKYGADAPIEITWKFENNEEMIVLLFVVEHLRGCGFSHIELCMPYIPNGRMDRVKSTDDVFTLKYFCNFINWLNFKKVTVLDPHSYVSAALINNIDIKNPDRYILQAIKSLEKDYPGMSRKDWIVFYPDEGAMKRYSGNLPYKYAFGIKQREWETGKIKGLDVAGCTEDIKDKVILIIDDICSKGGTFYHSAKKLKELGAKEVYLFVTHCENTIFEGELLKTDLIKKVYTTNSLIAKEHEKIEVFEI
jgi:ribose-phosphate pyrophosphokinase